MTVTTPNLRHAVSARRRIHASEQVTGAPAPSPVDSYTKPVNTWDDHRHDNHPLDVNDDTKPMPVSTRDASFWLALVFLVTPVWIIVPLSWTYTLYTSWKLYVRRGVAGSDPLQTWEVVLFAYSLFEVLFSIYYAELANIARAYKTRIPKRDMHELQLIFTRVLQSGLSPPISADAPSRPGSPAEPITTLKHDDPRAVDFRSHFRLWFWGAPWSEVTRTAMLDWLAWNTFDKDMRKLDNLQQTVIKEALVMIEKRTGGRLKDVRDGGKPHIVPLKVTHDEVNIRSRPAIVYIVADCINRLAKWYLEWVWDMKSSDHEGVEYLIRNPPSDADASPNHPQHPEPVIFMHGLGFGIAQYLFTIVFLLRKLPSNQPLIVPLQPNVSQAILHPTHLVPLPREQWVKGLKGIIDQFGGERAGVTMISHSLGSLAHCWMMKAYPELIKRSCFMDPVTFCLWEGDVCSNFIYRKPTNAMQLLMSYFVATEPGIALAVQRHFDWFANSLWFEEIPRARNPYYTSFHIGGHDAIVDGYRVKRFLMNHGIAEGLNWNPSGVHGQPCLFPAGMRQLTSWLSSPEPPEPRFDDSDSGSESESDEEDLVEYVLNSKAYPS
ncbi:hypothetical protein FRB94_001322 [Tulasnella sp. JGI-2019a]|nr:hypothetical protein FRB94_001322 [Tulasnella sp. JGI-2019a]KAG9016898.1 hypothetical protein FRB93_009428 [Tulasnella sp. JGI-2019a]KAG9040206.1 hypothetical protein FRB95_000135 [Tulasnella sp. JGI-2019a]